MDFPSLYMGYVNLLNSEAVLHYVLSHESDGEGVTVIGE